MWKKKWYVKPIYTLFALALVLSLGIVALPMAGKVEAAPPLTNDWPMFQGNLKHTGVAYPGLTGIIAPTQLWSYLTVGKVFGIAVADFNDDGIDDVVATATKSDGVESYVYVLNGTDGTLLWKHNVIGAKYHSTACTPAIVDVNKDGTLDVVVVSQNRKLYALSGVDGGEIWALPYTIGSRDASAPAIADINNDSVMDIVFAAGNTVYAITQAPSEVWIDDDWAGTTSGTEVESGKFFGF